MKKLIFLLFPLIVFSFACAQINDKTKVKPMAIKAAEDFFADKSQRENITYEIKGTSSCVLSGPEAVAKVDVVIKEGKKSIKKAVTVLCEKDINNGGWQVKSVMLE